LGPNTGTQQLDQTIECVVEVMGMGMPVARFEVAKTVERRAKSSGRMNPVIFLEAESSQHLGYHRHDLFHSRFEFRIAGTGVSIGSFVETGVRKHRSPPSTADSGDSFVARDAYGGPAQSRGQTLAPSQTQQPEQILITFDVSVQRWLAHPKLLGNLS